MSIYTTIFSHFFIYISLFLIRNQIIFIFTYGYTQEWKRTKDKLKILKDYGISGGFEVPEQGL